LGRHWYNDLLFILQGLVILTVMISLGVLISNLGLESLTQDTSKKNIVSCCLLPDGSRKIIILGEKMNTPPAFSLGTISNENGQVICFLLGKKISFTPTLQMGQVDVLFNIIKGKANKFLSDERK